MNRWIKYSSKYQGVWKKSLKAKVMHFLFSMSKLIGHTKQKSLLHKNQAFYLNILMQFSSQPFKEHVCQKLYNSAYK